MKKDTIITFGQVVLLSYLVGGLASAMVGCSVDFSGSIPPFGALPEPPDRNEDTVRVRFRNLTRTEAVNVEFHVSNTALDDLPDDLFVDEHLVTESIGVAGTGIIEPQTDDEIDLPCTDGLTLGTSGGVFLDNDTGQERGVGTARWVQESPLGLCGSIVTMWFFIVDDEFQTILTIDG